MRLSGRAIILLTAATISSSPARAQVIEFEAPSEIVVDESRLIVTFADTVAIEQATRVVRQAGGEVVEVNFAQAIVWGLFAAPPDPDSLLALRADVRVRALSVMPPSAAGDVWVTRGDGERVMADFSTHALRADLTSNVAAEDAVAIVRAYFPNLPLRVERYPNELVVRLPENGGDVASTLEADPSVRYVTYFSLDEPEISE